MLCLSHMEISLYWVIIVIQVCKLLSNTCHTLMDAGARGRGNCMARLLRIQTRIWQLQPGRADYADWELKTRNVQTRFVDIELGLFQV